MVTPNDGVPPDKIRTTERRVRLVASIRDHETTPRSSSTPPRGGQGFLHASALPLLGLPLGEMWDLDALALDCAADGTYDAFFTSAPIRLRGRGRLATERRRGH